ncbi:MAG TPA: TIM barrel protein [Blastocatellia bacterium]|nr:TIM barrel protein [Blastocatellia bacterium]
MTNQLSRREFIVSSSVALVATSFSLSAAPSPTSVGIARDSFPIRNRQAREAGNSTGPGIPAEQYIPLCESFGAGGCQMGFEQLVSTEADYLKGIRRMLEEKQMFLEFSVSSKMLGDADAMTRVAMAAKQLGVSRLRTAMLSGRRYEDYHEMGKWNEFVSNCQQTLERAVPLLEKHKLVAGIENHKDWLADEQVEMLRRFSNPHLGACVDFGNNMSLLEDSLEVARKLAPYVVTTHIKDMAVKPYEEGFLLSEVPLGDGITQLREITAVLRKARPDVHFCLEMITRDPLKVPYLTDHYWVTWEKRDTARIKKFEANVLSRASAKPLPVISSLSNEQRLAAENDNVRRSIAYARQTLKL